MFAPHGELGAATERPQVGSDDRLTQKDGIPDRRAMDRLFGVYLLASGAALALPGRPAIWPLLAFLHLAGAALALGPRALRAPAYGLSRAFPRAGAILHDWYPLALMPLLYKELATLNVAVWQGQYFDPMVLRVEEALFGTQPSFALSRAFPYLALSEPLHAAYLSYYLIIYGPPLLLYLRGRHADFRRLVFVLMLTFFVHYLVFVYFPVQGPRFLFPAPGGELARGPVYRLAHAVLASGSSRGAAFPSSHVAVAVAQSLLVFRYLPRLGPAVAVLAGALALGAVYGGFHYATDAIAGLVGGVLVFLVSGHVRRLFVGREPPA